MRPRRPKFLTCRWAGTLAEQHHCLSVSGVCPGSRSHPEAGQGVPRAGRSQCSWAWQHSLTALQNSPQQGCMTLCGAGRLHPAHQPHSCDPGQHSLAWEGSLHLAPGNPVPCTWRLPAAQPALRHCAQRLHHCCILALRECAAVSLELVLTCVTLGQQALTCQTSLHRAPCMPCRFCRSAAQPEHCPPSLPILTSPA